MFEFDLYEKRLRTEPAVRPEGTAPSALAVEKVALLVWGEHCIECAAPDCFSSCDLYQARPDKRCRRFTFGIFPNHSFRGPRGPGAEVQFKVWGKLESRGNARLANARLVHVAEKVILGLAPLVRVAGRLTGKVIGDFRFNYLSFTLLERLLWRLNPRRPVEEPPDAFLIEIYNPMPQAVAAQLTFAVDRSSLSRDTRLADVPVSYIRRLEIPPGYFRTIIPGDELKRVIGSGLRFAAAFTPEALSGTNLVFLTLDFVRFKDRDLASSLRPTAAAEPVVGGAAAVKPAVKCVVFDLDNTLWEGTLLEDGGVALRPGIVDLIKHFDTRGILLSVVSKNSFDHAWSRIKSMGLDEYFLYPKINWLPKSENLKSIAKDLNIGLDTFALIDDNPFERAEVSSALPMVECVDVTDIEALRTLPRYKGSTSDEARNRRRYYRDDTARVEQQAAFGEDYIGFLRACEIVVEVRAFSESDFDRVAELVQRTNQLNFSGHKYTREEVRTIIDDPARGKFVVVCSDKFGAYGTVGFCIVSSRPDRTVVEDFMLSCRVQGKLVEQALFSHLVTLHPDGKPRYLEVRFRATDRNKPAQQVLQALQFPVGDPAGCILDLSEHPLSCDFIELRGEASAERERETLDGGH